MYFSGNIQVTRATDGLVILIIYINFIFRAFRARVEQPPLLDRTRIESSSFKAFVRSKFSSSSRVKGSARSNSIISSFEQGRPVRCSTRTRLDSTRKPSLGRNIHGEWISKGHSI